MHDLYFWTIACLAIFLVSLAKSGLVGAIAVVGVPMLTLVMPPREAAGIMLPLLMLMDGFALWAYRKDVNWGVFKIFFPGALVGILIGWMLWSFVSDAAVILLIGIICLIFVLDAIFPLRQKLEGLPPSKFWGRFWGMTAGFTSFVSHTGGPPWQVWALPQRMEPRIYVGTASWTFAGINAAKLIPYAMLGQLSVGNLSTSLTLAPVAAVGMCIGIYLVRRISAKLFYRVAYILIALLTIKLLYDGIVGVFFAA